mmetsp:Transcript_24910/g.69752  ORF Transcript_24910/g.69752 Transcript_24910/m.69752 type:complete len:362 (+) Transcript_24910:564-1649(+)
MRKLVVRDAVRRLRRSPFVVMGDPLHVAGTGVLARAERVDHHEVVFTVGKEGPLQLVHDVRRPRSAVLELRNARLPCPDEAQLEGLLCAIVRARIGVHALPPQPRRVHSGRRGARALLCALPTAAVALPHHSSVIAWQPGLALEVASLHQRAPVVASPAVAPHLCGRGGGDPALKRVHSWLAETVVEAMLRNARPLLGRGHHDAAIDLDLGSPQRMVHALRGGQSPVVLVAHRAAEMCVGAAVHMAVSHAGGLDDGHHGGIVERVLRVLEGPHPVVPKVAGARVRAEVVEHRVAAHFHLRVVLASYGSSEEDVVRLVTHGPLQIEFPRGKAARAAIEETPLADVPALFKRAHRLALAFLAL